MTSFNDASNYLTPVSSLQSAGCAVFVSKNEAEASVPLHGLKAEMSCFASCENHWCSHRGSSSPLSAPADGRQGITGYEE